jgi:hypothetical protein
MRIVTTGLVSAATVGAVIAASGVASAVGGLGGPLFGLDAAPNGDVLVADAGSGITVIRNDRVRSSIALPGATAVSAIGTKSMWVTTSGEDPESDSGQALWRVSNGSARMVANLFELEESDPDGAGVDSNPYDVASLGGGAGLVVDAGGNTLWRVSNRGVGTLVATFPEELLSTANFNTLACGSPDCGAISDPAIPGQAVPTSVAVGPDGAYYVGELKGFPAPTDESNIWRIEPGATGVECGVDPQCTKVFDGGFTSIVDLDFGPDGTLYVSELDEASWAAVEIFNNPVGGTANACDLTTLTCQEIATGVTAHTAVTVDKKGTVYATVNGLTPGAGQVITLP